MSRQAFHFKTDKQWLIGKKIYKKNTCLIAVFPAWCPCAEINELMNCILASQDVGDGPREH